MRVVPPLTISDARLTDTTVAEPDTGEVVWDAATNWATGSVVYLAANHTRYERLTPGGVDATSPHLDDGTRWLELGPTNRWAMFDLLRNTGTTGASPLVVEITPGERVNSLGVLGMVADSLTVVVTSVSGGGVVFDETISLSTRDTGSWSDYFFGAFTFQEAVALFDLPPYSDAIITVTLERASGAVTVGSLILGMSVFLGDTQYSPRREALNFSVVERDEFGNSRMVVRRNVPKTSQTLWTRKPLVNKVLKTVEELNAVPALWSGLDDATDDYFEALLILGFYRNFSIDLSHPDVAVSAFELEEV